MDYPSDKGFIAYKIIYASHLSHSPIRFNFFWIDSKYSFCKRRVRHQTFAAKEEGYNKGH